MIQYKRLMLANIMKIYFTIFLKYLNDLICKQSKLNENWKITWEKKYEFLVNNMLNEELKKKKI
jgi:hypothetical protein